MNRIILSLVILFSVLTSCTEPTKEDVLREVFLEYVKTDFDDPGEYREVTSIEVVDTLNNKVYDGIIEEMKAVSILFSKKNRKTLEEFVEKLNADKTCIVTYEVKVRIERYGRKSIVKYYILDDGLEYKVQDHKIKTSEAPELYQDFFEFASQDIVDLAKD